MDELKELTSLGVKVNGVLEKFDGEGTDPLNLVEKIHIEDSQIVKVEFYEAGVKVGEEIVEEGGTN